MTAVAPVGHGSPARHPLAPGSTAAAIRGHLLVEDRELFDAALADAEDDGAVRETLEEWRGIAIVQSDRERFVRTVRRAAEHRTGEASPDDEPLHVTRAKAGM